jgi:hypothetical protein
VAQGPAEAIQAPNHERARIPNQPTAHATSVPQMVPSPGSFAGGSYGATSARARRCPVEGTPSWRPEGSNVEVRAKSAPNELRDAGGRAHSLGCPRECELIQLRAVSRGRLSSDLRRLRLQSPGIGMAPTWWRAKPASTGRGRLFANKAGARIASSGWRRASAEPRSRYSPGCVRPRRVHDRDSGSGQNSPTGAASDLRCE